MPSRTLTLRVTGIEDAIASLAPALAKKVIYMSINEVSKQLRTEASAVIREKYNLTKPFIDKEILRIPATSQRPSSIISVSSGKGMRLIGFDAQGTRGKIRTTFLSSKRELKKSTLKSKKKQGVSVKILRAGGRTRLPRAFIATMRSGHVGVFRRSSTKKMRNNPKRAAIIEQALVTLATLFGSQRVLTRLDTKFHKKFPIIFARNYTYQSKLAKAR